MLIPDKSVESMMQDFLIINPASKVIPLEMRL